MSLLLFDETVIYAKFFPLDYCKIKSNIKRYAFLCHLIYMEIKTQGKLNCQIYTERNKTNIVAEFYCTQTCDFSIVLHYHLFLEFQKKGLDFSIWK